MPNRSYIDSQRSIDRIAIGTQIVSAVAFVLVSSTTRRPNNNELVEIVLQVKILVALSLVVLCLVFFAPRNVYIRWRLPVFAAFRVVLFILPATRTSSGAFSLRKLDIVPESGSWRRALWKESFSVLLGT